MRSTLGISATGRQSGFCSFLSVTREAWSGGSMMDAILVFVTVGFFALSVGYVALCDKL